MARTKTDPDLTPVTGSVSPALREAIEAHRWTARKTVSDVVREALQEWAVKRNLFTQDVAAPDTLTDAVDAPEEPTAEPEPTPEPMLEPEPAVVVSGSSRRR